MEPEYPSELSPELSRPEDPGMAPALGGGEAKPVRDRSKLRDLEMYLAKRHGEGYVPNLDGYAVKDYVDRLLEQEPD